MKSLALWCGLVAVLAVLAAAAPLSRDEKIEEPSTTTTASTTTTTTTPPPTTTAPTTTTHAPSSTPASVAPAASNPPAAQQEQHQQQQQEQHHDPAHQAAQQHHDQVQQPKEHHEPAQAGQEHHEPAHQQQEHHANAASEDALLAAALAEDARLAEEHKRAQEENFIEDVVLYADEVPVDYDAYDEPVAEEEGRKKEFDSEYQRYLEEMTEEMLNDPALRDEILREIEQLHTDDKDREDNDLYDIARRLRDEGVRTELEEQERQVIERQRRVVRRANEVDWNIEHQADDYNYGDADETAWLDPSNPENIEKIRKIAEQRVQMIEDIDEVRHKAFVEREMERELEFREALRNVTDPETRAIALANHQAETEELKKHKGHQPGSKAQLEEVWKHEDGMEGMDFDPKVFFRLHDINNDGVLDIKEIEAIFYHQATQLHTVNSQVDDIAVREEMAVMREFLLGKVDSNKDGVMEETEFLELAKDKDFVHDIAWDAIFPKFTEDELTKFAEQRRKAFHTAHNDHIDPNLVRAGRRKTKEIRERQDRRGANRSRGMQKSRA